MPDLRVFISSTFRDLQEEREHLVKKIFPEIRALCRARGITFTEVDLRWGLTDEDVVLGQVIRTCLEEIDRCRPYFIGITGERYGHVPDLLEYYKDADLLRRYPWIQNAAMEGSSIIDLEFRHAALNDPTTISGTGNDGGWNGGTRFFFRRSRRAQLSAVDDAEAARLAVLQQRVRDSGLPVEEFRDPGSLGEAVYEALLEIIDHDFADVVPPTRLEEERTRHRAFAESRRHAYIPNPEYLHRLDNWLPGTEPPMVIYAESGSGKSSLVSFWCDLIRRSHPDLPIIEHYVGIGAGTIDHFGVMQHIIHEVAEIIGRELTVPREPGKVAELFADMFGFLKEKRLVIVIDGINQLTGEAQQLTWLPRTLPSNVRLIITSTVEQTLVDLRSRGWVHLGMQPLKEREREAVIVRYLSEFHKALAPELVHRIAEDAKCAHPLFLRTLLEELRLDSGHEQLPQHVDAYLQTTGTEDLFQAVLERMENDYGARAVRDVMSRLWGSRFGLGELALVELTGLSRLKLSAMLSGLDYHLVRNEDRYTFFHDYLLRAVEKRYLNDPARRDELWRQLVDFFEQAVVTPKSVQELVHAYSHLGDEDGVLRTLSRVDRFIAMSDERSNRYEVLSAVARMDQNRVAEAWTTALAHWERTSSPDGDEYQSTSSLVVAYLSALGKDTEAIPILDRMIDRARLANDRGAELAALILLSNSCTMTSALSEARGHAARAIAIARELGDKSTICAALGAMSNVHLTAGELDMALDCLDERLELLAELGDVIDHPRALITRSGVLTQREEYDEALSCLDRAEAITQDLGDRKTEATANAYRALLFLYTNRLDRAEACLAKAEQTALVTGDTRLRANVVGNLGLVYFERGEYDRAEEYYMLHNALCHEIEERIGAAISTCNLGEIAEVRGDFEGALAKYAEGVHELVRIGSNAATTFPLEATARILIDHPLLCDVDFPWPDRSDDAPLSDEISVRALQRARDLAYSALRYATSIGLRDRRIIIPIILARIDYASGNHANATERLLTLLDHARADEERADVHYWLWKCGMSDHASIARECYTALERDTPKHLFRTRLDELRGESASP